MQTISDEELTKLRAKYPRGVKVYPVGSQTEDGKAPADDADEFVFRVPTRTDYQAYKADVKKGLMGAGNLGIELTNFARKLLVWPESAAFEALLERAPIMGEELGSLLLETCAGGLEVREGKR